jgi:hypothetical protein
MTGAKPSFRVARIIYVGEMTKADARVIPLGSLSEVVLPHMHGLALKARDNLRAAELEIVHPLMRERLSNPFAFLRSEFDAAWKEARAGQALDFLAGRHTASLSVLAPTDFAGRSWLFSRLLPARKDAVIAKLVQAVDSEFAELMKRYGNESFSDRTLIESIREAA